MALLLNEPGFGSVMAASCRHFQNCGPPKIVAIASPSPLSPVPVPTQNAAQNTAVPRLEDHAATVSESAHSEMPLPAPPNPVTMDPAAAPSGFSDTIVVGGDYSGESHDESDESIDYGEGEEGQKQGGEEPDTANDDYAKTFDSPAAHEDQDGGEEAQPDVSMASISMNSAATPDPAAVPSDHPPTPPPALPHTNGEVQAPETALPSEQTNGSDHPPELPPAAASTIPSSAAPAATSATEPAETQTPATPASNGAPASAAPAAPASANEDDASVDIQKLVDDITARAAATDSPSNPPVQTSPVTSQAPPVSLPTSHPPSLPPKPSLPNLPAGLPAIPPAHYSFQPRGHNAPAAPAVPMSLTNSVTSHSAYVANEGLASLPAPPPGVFGATSHSHVHHMSHAGDPSSGNYHGSSTKQLWEQFQADEKRYTSEARWERFPEGSRIFIGNLSSERVSKREVFDVFHRFGRLAQISLKSAYGFVQYHTIAEGNAAMQGAQGIELGGRKIHLEISRAQKKKDDRDRSPDRRGPRGSQANERFDNGDRSWKRDDYRPVRSPSPRRNDPRGGRDGHYPRDRGFDSHQRRRSRSPARFSRYGGDDSYRRRSPSPHRRAPSDGDRFDLPRRFGADVPDVQILLLQEVSREFVGWVQGAFHNKGLKTDVMYLNPRFPRETVLQRQVVEGVYAIVDLDYGAQTKGKIPVQVFIRSGGSSVRFELYQDVDPPIAAELVAREKSQSAAHLAQPQASYAPTSLQNPQAGAAQTYPGVPVASAPQAAQIDMNALLGNLRNAAAAQPASPTYGAAPTYGVSVGAAPNGYGGMDPAQQVQTIMDQLKRAAH
ncbi:hypothetical protein CHGG_09668 [Chaetomium globosum CBS 148.51]|uniref:RRM domain-containing protein n=1 Tax=Chaetomium globosum (strain ATCC 6205 / CBS 148.51 / DSM 1962 / NBRC 6347 / NRRL 1970) TaxID=306901 RepID=Q2GQT6_CHAGB|nr:uncharacterized protein CHGG_09668 [Chaetomium globosum CBS 148.51]EAQ83264.1 hypothetical protein CHGG_09668 [Chaetomium globosum CBS 148.51]